MIGTRSLVRVFALGVVLASLAAFPAASGAMEAPSRWWIEKMNENFPHWGAVRVRQPGNRLVLRGPIADSEGIRWQEPVTADVRDASTDGAAADRLVPWSAIERIDRPTRATAFGALIGGTAGTLAAVVLGAADSEVDELAVAGMIAGGAGLGAVLGGGGVRWQRFYPPLDDGIPLKPKATASR